MLRVGLTGGLATGKSVVGDELERLGCTVIRADNLGHAVIAPGGEAHEAVLAHFGPGVLNADGSVNRSALAARVFDAPDELKALNAMVHPAVFRRQRELMRAAEARDPSGISVVEAAILIEAGNREAYDKIVVAVCTEEQQIERAMQRGLSHDALLSRLRHQMPMTEKIKYADYIVDTSGDMERTLEQTRMTYETLRRVQ